MTGAMEGVGQRMRNAMDARGFSEASIASRLGVHKSTYNNWLNDRSEPKFETLLEFCEIVGIDVSDIIRREDDSPLNMTLEPENDEFVKINVYDVDLAAGDGRVASNRSTNSLFGRLGWIVPASIPLTLRSCALMVRAWSRRFKTSRWCSSIIGTRHQFLSRTSLLAASVTVSK